MSAGAIPTPYLIGTNISKYIIFLLCLLLKLEPLSLVHLAGVSGGDGWPIHLVASSFGSIGRVYRDSYSRNLRWRDNNEM